MRNIYNKFLIKNFFKCCSKCKKNDKGGKTCICVVPAK